MNWQIEAAMALMWAMGAPIKLGHKFRTQRSRVVLDLIPALGESTAAFIDEARLRQRAVTGKELDVTFKAHCRARDSILHNTPIPKIWEYGVIYERHHALNWLTFYCNDDWDDVTADT